ncbi:hypothetical protein L345_16517, partial [Ophiophagus hannah]
MALVILYNPLHPSLYVYYLIQFSYYCSLIITMPFDVKQKGFNIIIVHHMVTILLIGFSYCVNFIPVGLLVMILHDIPDIPIYVEKEAWNKLEGIEDKLGQMANSNHGQTSGEPPAQASPPSLTADTPNRCIATSHMAATKG